MPPDPFKKLENAVSAYCANPSDSKARKACESELRAIGRSADASHRDAVKDINKHMSRINQLSESADQALELMSDAIDRVSPVSDEEVEAVMAEFGVGGGGGKRHKPNITSDVAAIQKLLATLKTKPVVKTPPAKITKPAPLPEVAPERLPPLAPERLLTDDEAPAMFDEEMFGELIEMKEIVRDLNSRVYSAPDLTAEEERMLDDAMDEIESFDEIEGAELSASTVKKAASLLDRVQSHVEPDREVTPVNPPAKPVTPPAKPVTPPAKPVTPPAKPVTPPVKPVTPPVKPVTPPEKQDAPPVPGPDTYSQIQSRFNDAPASTSQNKSIFTRVLDFLSKKINGWLEGLVDKKAAKALDKPVKGKSETMTQEKLLDLVIQKQKDIIDGLDKKMKDPKTPQRFIPGYKVQMAGQIKALETSQAAAAKLKAAAGTLKTATKLLDSATPDKGPEVEPPRFGKGR